MRNYAFFVFVWFWAAALGKAADKISMVHEAHARAQLAFQAEQARAKDPLCPKAMTTLDINKCYSAELATTDRNYLELARALSDLLHPGDKAETTSPPNTIPFDDAEAVWQTYRKMSCEAARDVYAGTIRTSIELGCQITLTRHHMNELWAVYSEVGMH